MTRRIQHETVFSHGFGQLSNANNELPDPEKVAICKQWLSENAKIKRIPKSDCINSYTLKHRIEEDLGEYIPNGACIQAAIELGYKYWRGHTDWYGEDWINARLYMTLNPRPEDERAKPTGFSKWLFSRGELYFRGDAALDPDWPRTASRFIDFWRYLEFSEKAQEDLCLAWKHFSGQDPPRPDLIDQQTIEAVYDRECDFISFGEKYPKAPAGTKYLYALCETDKNPRFTESKFIRVKYIGQTDDPSNRLVSHILSPGNLEKVKWIGGLLDAGEKPEMAIFLTVAAEEVNRYERAAIYAFQPWETRLDPEYTGFPPLDDALLNLHK